MLENIRDFVLRGIRSKWESTKNSDSYRVRYFRGRVSYLNLSEARKHRFLVSDWSKYETLPLKYRTLFKDLNQLHDLSLRKALAPKKTKSEEFNDCYCESRSTRTKITPHTSVMMMNPVPDFAQCSNQLSLHLFYAF